MKLSVELVFDNLPERMHPQLLNAGNGLLSLDRPRLYEGSDAAFAGNHLYLVKADRLPARAHADRTAAIVCIGDSPRLARYASRCAVIRLDEDADFYATFNEIQAVFDKYDAWEDRLDSIAAEDADISRMLTESESVLDNALYAIDADFKILGASNLASQLGDTGGFRSEDGTSLRLSSFDTFLQNNELRLEEEEPLRIEISGESTLNYNLHSGGEYRGCVGGYTARRVWQGERACGARRAPVRVYAAEIAESPGEFAAGVCSQHARERVPKKHCLRASSKLRGDFHRLGRTRQKQAL